MQNDHQRRGSEPAPKPAQLSNLLKSSERERVLADVVETANMPFAAGAPDGRLIMFNQAFALLTGYSRAELEQRALTWTVDLTPPEWHGFEQTQLAEAVRTRQPVRYEKEYVSKDGTRIPVEHFVQPIFDAAGQLLHYRCFSVDVTARKRAEAALHEREEQLRLFAQHAPAAIAMFDQQMRYLVVSQRWLSDFGLTGQSLRGRSQYDVFPGLPDGRHRALRRGSICAGRRAHAMAALGNPALAYRGRRRGRPGRF